MCTGGVMYNYIWWIVPISFCLIIAFCIKLWVKSLALCFTTLYFINVEVLYSTDFKYIAVPLKKGIALLLKKKDVRIFHYSGVLRVGQNGEVRTFRNKKEKMKIQERECCSNFNCDNPQSQCTGARHVVLPIFCVFKPETVTVTNPDKLVLDNCTEQRSWSAWRRLQEPSNPDIDVLVIAFIQELCCPYCLAARSSTSA